jgi:hypothetical protein
MPVYVFFTPPAPDLINLHMRVLQEVKVSGPAMVDISRVLEKQLP